LVFHTRVPYDAFCSDAACPQLTGPTKANKLPSAKIRVELFLTFRSPLPSKGKGERITGDRKCHQLELVWQCRVSFGQDQTLTPAIASRLVIIRDFVLGT
jgi:hypothetical protein